VLLFWASLTPSLLPRSPVFQGVVVGVAMLLGYGLGALLGWLVRLCGGRLTGVVRRRAWWALGLLALVGTVVMVTAYVRWESALRTQIGVDDIDAASVVSMLLVAAAFFVVALALARSLRAAGRVVGRWVSRLLPARVATVVGGLVVATVVYLAITGVATDRLLQSLDATYMAVNKEFSTDVPAPTSRFVSGGARSAVSWEDLGRQGRVFVANAPTRSQIAAFSGGTARTPVRAYVGVGTDGDVDLPQQAAIAVTELERLGGFRRAVLNVVTCTGSGWVNENQAQALEYLWDGDTATVSMQYSYLPSWMSFLADGNRAEVAGRLLFDAVYAHWSALPADRRPKLVVSGESLGSWGAESAFTSARDVTARTDGALFVGPTADNPLWRRFTTDRDPGTPEVLPTYDGGATVRFADNPAELTTLGPWSGHRIGYLQHANDPVTWWDWSLALHKPDWLSEPRGRDVSPSIHWIPVVTMLQLAADQMVANDVPNGTGHQFGTAPVYAWATILPPPGWDAADTSRLAATITTNRAETIS
jgi:uncharacterized membrane protein